MQDAVHRSGTGVLALHASVEQDGHRFADPDGDGTSGARKRCRQRGLAAFSALLAPGGHRPDRPADWGRAAVASAGRKIYTNILGKGREVSFPADTPIQVRLAPGPTPEP